MQKRSIRTAISVFITISLLIYVLSKVSFTSMLEVFKSINLTYYILAILLYLFGIIISSIRWQVLLSALNMDVPLTKLLSFYLSGYFFNFFTPTNIGGDVVRMHSLSSYSNEKIKSVTSVFMDRFSGLLALGTIGAIALIFGYKFLDKNLVFALAFILGIAFCSFILIFKKFELIYNASFKFFNFLNLGNEIELLYKSVLVYAAKKKFFLTAIILSFIFHISGPICLYLLSSALGLDIPLVYLFLIFPISTILTTLPISISGFGVREATYYYFLAMVGISASQTLSLLITGYSIRILFTLLGGVVHLTIRRK